ncbi:MAG: DUF3783 domain-containing protein [Clostridium sp.]|nr:DUF3783 domain-containing protein [Clostridium sp.]
MKTIYSSISKRVFSLLVALIMAISTVPFAAASAFAQEQGISITTSTITPNTKSVEVTLAQSGEVGFVRVIQLDSEESYSGSMLLNSEVALSEIVPYATLNEGNNTIVLTGTPVVGKKVVAVLRDASGETQDYVSAPITVTASGTSSGGETTKPTQAEILAGCEVTIDGFAGGKITEDATSLTANVKLHSSVKSCYMIVAVYPANTVFDPDSTATKQLYSVRVENGKSYTCNFAESLLPLKVGQKVCAYLNVPVAETENDVFYKQKQSRELTVVDKNGEGFRDYTWPEVSIADKDLKAGDTKLHINFSADERLLAYAKDENVDFNMTVSIQQYPQDKTFDFEGSYMRRLTIPLQFTKNLTNYEINLEEPLLAGYRVRAVVYWNQNTALYIPKGNDYEAESIPDDSVLIPAVPVAPTVKINADKIKAGASAVSVVVAGDVEEGSNLIIRQYASADAVQGNAGEFFGNKSVSEAGTVSVEKNSYGKELAGGKYVAAVLMKGGTVVAYSNAVPVVLETEMEKPVLTVNGDVYEGDTKVSLAVSKTDLIPSGKGTINLYKADAEGKVEVWGELESVGSKSPVVSGDAVEITLTKTLTAGDILVPYIYYYDGDADRQYYYPGTAFTVKAKAEGDSISVSPEALTADTESITVSVNGYDSYKGGYVFVRLADSNNTHPDAAAPLKSQSFTGSGRYTFDVKGKLTPEKYVLVYLYKWDSDTDRTYYSDDKVYILIGGKVVKEPSVEITSSKILSTDKNLYVKADFDKELTGNLKLYTYRYGGAFDSANVENALLYSGAVTPSAYGSKITFTNDLTAGDKIVAVLTLTGGESEVVKISDAKNIQAPPQITEPSVYIREEHVSEGDTKMETYLNFERNYYDSVSYVLYNYTGEELDESTAKIAAESRIYSPGVTTMGFRESVKPLKAGSKLMIKLTLVKNGVSKVVYSNAKTVEAAPDWATPTVSIDVAAVRVTDTTIPVTVTYDVGYTEMSDYYCNVTAYQFPSDYTDDDFEKKELHESQITQRIGQCNANKASKEHFTTIKIPVKANTLEAGKRLIVKLRLPHPEWAGEEADYLSYSVPIIGAEEEIPAAKVLLFNLGADTVKGSKIRAILEEMGIKAVTVEKSQINQSVGYLAGYKGFAGDAEAFTGSGYTAEFMLMSGLSETQLDQFLAKMRAADAVIDHKATVTETNKQWSFKELIGEIEEEHEVMQAWLALKNAVKEAEALQEADYSAEKWAAFAKVLADAKEVSKVEATAEEYNNATKALQDAYKALTAKPESGGGSSSGGRKSKTQKNETKVEETKENNETKAKEKTIVEMQIGRKSISVNGNLAQKDAAPVIQNSRTLVPIRFITESLGGAVAWNGESKEVTLLLDGKEIKMTIGKTLEKYGVAPVIMDSRTYVPVRFVADALGAQTSWNEAEKTVTLVREG